MFDSPNCRNAVCKEKGYLANKTPRDALYPQCPAQLSTVFQLMEGARSAAGRLQE